MISSEKRNSSIGIECPCRYYPLPTGKKIFNKYLKGEQQ